MSFLPVSILIFLSNHFHQLISIFLICFSADHFSFHFSFLYFPTFSYFMPDHSKKIVSCCLLRARGQGCFFESVRFFEDFRWELIWRFWDFFSLLRRKLLCLVRWLFFNLKWIVWYFPIRYYIFWWVTLVGLHNHRINLSSCRLEKIFYFKAV